MERLRHSDYRRLLDFVAALQEPAGRGQFGRKIVELTSGLLPGATIAFDQICESDGRYSIDHNLTLHPDEHARIIARLREVYRENPIYQYIQSGGTGPVVDIADLAQRSTFHRTDFYQDIFRPYGIEHQINVILSREGWINTLTINHARAFDGRSKQLLALASRHILLAHREAYRFLGTTDLREILSSFTPREAEVFAWMREGKRNSEIATILGCSARTIDKHVQRILSKTGTETRTAATRLASEG